MSDLSKNARIQLSVATSAANAIALSMYACWTMGLGKWFPLAAAIGAIDLVGEKRSTVVKICGVWFSSAAVGLMVEYLTRASGSRAIFFIVSLFVITLSAIATYHIYLPVRSDSEVPGEENDSE